MKRIICIAFISIACCFSFLTGYCSLYSAPVYGAQDQWETLTSNEQLVDAFKVYCKSRNTVIDGSVLDAVTSFTTNTFNNICNTLGIDMTLLQAEIQRMYSGTGYKYAFSASGLSGFNRIFSEFLQNNDLSVGDTVNDKILYSGKYFTDLDGNSCFVFTPTTNVSILGTWRGASYFNWGSAYKYTGLDIYNLYSPNIPSGSTGYNFNINYNLNDSNKNVSIQYGVTNSSSQYGVAVNYTSLVDGTLYIYNKNSNYVQRNGLVCIVFENNNLYLCNLCYEKRYDEWRYYFYNRYKLTNTNPNTVPSVNITLNSTSISSETVINEGDTIIYNNDGTPDSGGGGGDDDPDQGDDWNPVLPDVPSAGSDPSGGNTIDWPDIDLPDFGLSNFSLGDLRLKFPFSIPFDIVSILGVINAPAVAPVIQEDIPIRIDLMNVDYTIPINLDMSDSVYDDFANLVRSVEFIGFCLGLIHLTIRLVKG